MTHDSNSLVDTAWLDAHLDDPNVCLIEIDWEGKDAYEEGHLPGAIGWNWKEALWDSHIREFPSPRDFADRMGQAGITNDTTVVFYGCPVQFGTYGWWVFKYCGHADARVLNGGKTRWLKEGRPLTNDVPARSPCGYEPVARNDAMRAKSGDVLAALDGSETLILDHRSDQEYSGTMVGVPGKHDDGAERYGRIPGARHVPFVALLNDDETFKTAEEMKALVEAAGGTADQDIISYCRLSHRATLAYFAMTELLGYQHVRSYDGSWTEWGSIVGVPIER